MLGTLHKAHAAPLPICTLRKGPGTDRNDSRPSRGPVGAVYSEGSDSEMPRVRTDGIRLGRRVVPAFGGQPERYSPPALLGTSSFVIPQSTELPFWPKFRNEGVRDF